VIGGYPQYIESANLIGAKAFQIPMSIWTKMSPAERIAANMKFIDRGIANHDVFLLASGAHGAGTEAEIQRLIQAGYVAVEDSNGNVLGYEPPLVPKKE
jgi:hypothetical protein